MNEWERVESDGAPAWVNSEGEMRSSLRFPAGDFAVNTVIVVEEEAPDELANVTLTALQDRAAELGISGRSRMNKAELAAAIAAIEAGEGEEG